MWYCLVKSMWIKDIMEISKHNIIELAQATVAFKLLEQVKVLERMEATADGEYWTGWNDALKTVKNVLKADILEITEE